MQSITWCEEDDNQLMERIEIMEIRKSESVRWGDTGDYQAYTRELRSLTKLCEKRDHYLYLDIISETDIFGYEKKLREMQTWE